MICLSKADEDSFRHLAWNQSPSPLAASHTTRQDLNGIANLREHVDADQDDGAGGTGGGLLGSPGEKCQHLDQPPGSAVGKLTDAGRLSRISGLSSCLKMVNGGDDHDRLSRDTSSSCLMRIWSWAVWILSVLIVSTLLSHWNSMSTPSSSPIISSHAAPVITDAPVLRKRDRCAAGGADAAVYNTGLHVMALFIILFTSSLACAFPILASKFPQLRINANFFFAVRHFGTGVLIATAFVHLLPTAFTSLGNPCLSDFWTKDYTAMPGAIALSAVFLVTIIEMVFHPSRHMAVDDQASRDQTVVSENADSYLQNSGVFPMRGHARGKSTSMGQGLSRLRTADGPDTSEHDGENEERSTSQENNDGENDDCVDLPQPKKSVDSSSLESLQIPVLSPEQKQRKELLQCVLLELGILFHSVFIGMAISVSIGNRFIILLIAIIFHQTFEGLALGSRIAAVKWPQGKRQPWLMALAYGCTTPIGQALGLATHTLYSPNSEVGLIVVGVMNAISAGLLTFASLVELMSEDFLSDESWRCLRGKKRVVACLLVFFGAFFMSLVGAWA